MEDRTDALLASALGLEQDELDELDYRLDSNESDDGLVYGYIVTVADGNDPELLSKIKGLEGDTVRLDA
ncbi:hypothetical protein [Kaistia terrae]|uniref:Magnesium transporter n=1 Tax=Kaistia terrae TaxID=537017 RepID=A0ABW0Q0D6_9HYPH|nr:hypothetical protein [Kaistia terrae]MCX5578976.1 hypothetical protein [Kaistia terrae]